MRETDEQMVRDGASQTGGAVTAGKMLRQLKQMQKAPPVPPLPRANGKPRKRRM